MINIAHRVVKQAPREHLYTWLYLQLSLTIATYDCTTFIIQATSLIFAGKTGAYIKDQFYKTNNLRMLVIS
jgi:hypothetical protein